MNQIETARILIRPYRPSDADSVWQVLRRKEIYDTTYAIPRNYPRERWIGGSSLWKAREKTVPATNSACLTSTPGLILQLRRDQCSARLALRRYFLLCQSGLLEPGLRHRGLFRHAGFAFNELGLCRVSGRCMAKNGASRKVMEKLGFLYEGTGRRELLKDGVFYDVDHLAILKEEWAGYLGF